MKSRHLGFKNQDEGHCDQQAEVANGAPLEQIKVNLISQSMTNEVLQVQ